jgi:hypothetical protein
MLLACACVTLMVWFSQDDSPAGAPSPPHVSHFYAPTPPAYDLHSPSSPIGPGDAPVPKIDAQDEKLLKGFDSKLGPESPFPLQDRHEPGDAMPLVPIQSVKPVR